MKQSNPFKFGSIVDTPYFINREKEIHTIREIIESQNHLVIISPRRYGKTSLVHKALKNSSRKVIFLNLQFAKSIQDFAQQYLRQIYRLYPMEKLKQSIKSFRIVPTLSINPLNSELEVSFQPGSNAAPILEDVLNLLENISSSRNRPIVVLDEFQDFIRLDKMLDKQLRSVIQNHKNITYLFLGSQESMMVNIFERKKSPFYHFAHMMRLGKIDQKHFAPYISNNFRKMIKKPKVLADKILDFTGCHPYYTQQLAFLVWNQIKTNSTTENPIREAIAENIQIHDYDFERLWINLTNTEKKVLSGLAISTKEPLSADFLRYSGINATSTVFSSIKKLIINGFVIKTEKGYELDDPFFKQWLIQKYC